MAKRNILVKLGLDDTEFQKKMDAAQKSINRSSNAMIREGRRLSIASRELFMGLTLPMIALGKVILDATAKMERLELGIKAVGKGIPNMDVFMSDLRDLAKLPGLSLENVFGAANQLLAVNRTGSETIEIIRGIGTGIARAGKTADDFGRVIIQLTQALSKGKLTMQDFRTVFEQLPEARSIIAEAFGTSDLEELRKKGISVIQVIDAMKDAFLELGAEGISESLSNNLENFKDQLTILLSTIGRSVFLETFVSALKDITGTIEKLTERFNSMSPRTKETIINFTKMAAAVALIAPLLTFLHSRLFILGGLLLKYSTTIKLVRTLQISMAASTKAMAAGFSSQAIVMASLGKTMGAVGAAMRGLWKVIRIGVPFLGELYLLFEGLKLIFPSIQTSIDDAKKKWTEYNEAIAEAEKIHSNLADDLRALKRERLLEIAEHALIGMGAKFGGGGPNLGEFDNRLVQLKEILALQQEYVDNASDPAGNPALAKALADELEAAKKLLDIEKSREELERKIREQYEKQEKIFSQFKTELDYFANRAEKNFLPAITTVSDQLEIAKGYLKESYGDGGYLDDAVDYYGRLNKGIEGATDALEDFLIMQGKIPSFGLSLPSAGAGPGDPNIDTQSLSGEMFEDVTAGAEEMYNRLRDVENALKSMADLGYQFGEALGGAFGTMADGIAGAITGTGSLAKAFANAAKEVLTWLLKMIIKLAIANVLMAIFFPGKSIADVISGAVQLTGTISKIGAGLIKGVSGLAEGGIAMRPMMANIAEEGPEAVIPLNKLDHMDLGAPTQIELRGKFIMEGRDLVYTVERNQVIINGVRR